MMRHEDCILLLDDFADDTLPAETAAAVGLHVRDCPSCAAELDEIRELKIRAASMPAGITPHEDPWPGINHSIHEHTSAAPSVANRVLSRRGLMGVAWAAAALFAFAVFWPHDDRSALERDSLINLLDADYAVLQGDGEQVLATGDAVAHDELASGMSIIDQAIHETRAAMDKVQGTPEQIRRLNRGYLKKMDLLQHLVQRASGS